MTIYEGPLIGEFLADRVASGFSDEVVRAQFEAFFKSPLSEAELETWKENNKPLIHKSGIKLIDAFEKGRIPSKLVALMERIESDISDARSANDLKGSVMLLQQLRGFMELAFERKRESREERDAAKGSVDVAAALEEVERAFPDLLLIPDKEKLRKALKKNTSDPEQTSDEKPVEGIVL